MKATTHIYLSALAILVALVMSFLAKGDMAILSWGLPWVIMLAIFLWAVGVFCWLQKRRRRTGRKRKLRNLTKSKPPKEGKDDV